MANSLTREIVKRRKAKKLTQRDVADKLAMKRATYAKKESEGDFSLDEVPGLHRALGGSKEELIELTRQNDQIKVEDWKEYLIKNAINSNAALRVLLMALSEILAKQRGESVTKVLNELTMAVEGEKSMHSLR